MEIIIGLGILLVFITLLGHGLWVMAASFLRLFTDRSTTANSTTGPTVNSCPNCGQYLLAIHPGCPHCGQGLPAQLSTVDNVKLQTLLFQVQALAQRGFISVAAQRLLIKNLERELAKTTRPASTVSSPVSQPIVSTPTLSSPLAEPIAQQPIIPDRIQRWAEKQQPSQPSNTEQLSQPAPKLEWPTVEPTPTPPLGEPLAIPATPLKPWEVPITVQPLKPNKELPKPGSWELAQRDELPKMKQQPVEAEQSWGEWLSGFMEQNHIRWGELVGGMLIVCCSIALVISFWNQIAEKPWLQFLLFNGITASFFLVGLYSERRWKLENTSRVLLIIATLLVPLNYLAIAAFTKSGTLPMGIVLLGESLTSGLFVWLLLQAGQVLVPKRAWLLPCAVLPAAISLLIMRRFQLSPIEAVIWQSLLAISTICYLALSIWWTQRVDATDEELETWAMQTLRLLGISTFATLTAWALLIFKLQPTESNWSSLAPWSVLLAFPSLLYGSAFWSRLSKEQFSGLRTIGLSIVIAGGLLLVAAQICAWPVPGMLIFTAFMTAVVLGYIGRRMEQPWCELPVAMLTAWGLWLITVIWFGGSLTLTSNTAHELIQGLKSPTAGWLLLPIALLCGGVAAWYLQRSQQIAATAWGIVVALAAIVSMVLVGWQGFGVPGDPYRATWLFLLYGLAATAVAWWLQQPGIAIPASLLLMLASLQGILFGLGGANPQPIHFISAGLIFSVAAALLGMTPRRGDNSEQSWQLSWVWHGSALLTVAALSVWLFRFTTLAAWSSYWQTWLALALVIAVISLAQQSASLWNWCQATLLVATINTTIHTIAGLDWYQATSTPAYHPWLWQILALVLVVLATLWFAVRRLFWRISTAAVLPDDQGATPGSHWVSRLQQQFNGQMVGLDQLGIMFGLLMHCWFACGSIAPGIVKELAPANSILQIPKSGVVASVSLLAQADPTLLSQLALGNWLLLGLLLATMLWMLWVDSKTWLIWASFQLLPCGLALFASWATDAQAVVTVCRWLAVLAMLVSAAVILRLPRWATATASDDDAQASSALQPVWSNLPGNWANQMFAVHSTFVICISLLLVGAGTILVLFNPAAQVMHQALFGASILGCIMLVVGTEQSNWLGRALTGVCCIAGVVLIAPAVHGVWLALNQEAITGPLSSSFWATLPRWLSMALSLGIASLCWCAIGWRKHTAPLALLAATMWTGAWLVGVVLHGQEQAWSWDTSRHLANLATLTIASALAALVWFEALTIDRRKYGLGIVGEPSQWLTAWSVLPLLSQLVILLPAGAWLWLNPVATPGLSVVGSTLGWIAFGLSLVVVLRVHHLQISDWKQVLLPILIGTSGILIAGTLQRYNWDTGNRLGLHVWGVMCWLMLAVWLFQGFRVAATQSADITTGHLSEDQRSLWTWWSLAFAGLSLLICLRNLDIFPQQPFWSVASYFVMTIGLLATAWLVANRNLVTLAALVAHFGMVFTIDLWIGGLARTQVLANLCALTSLVPLWYWLDRLIQQRQISSEIEPFRIRWYRAATLFGLLGLTLIVGSNVGLHMVGFNRNFWPMTLTWVAVLTTGLALLTLCWDQGWRWPAQLMYAWGILVSGQLLCSFGLQGNWFEWSGLLVMAAFTVGTSYLWTQREKLPTIFKRATVEQLGVGDEASSSPSWLIVCNSLLVMFVLIGATASQFTFTEATLRFGAAKAGLAQAATFGLLAWGRRRSSLQSASLGVGVFGTVLLTWAGLVPDQPDWGLNYAILALAAVIGMGLLYGFGFSKLLRKTNDWTLAATRLMPLLMGLAACLLVGVLTVEVVQFAEQRSVAIANWAVLIVGGCLLALTIGAIVAALVPGRDPLNLPEANRGRYIYAAEGLLAMLFLHLRVCCPSLFGGRMEQYWPLIIITLAFAGVGLSEIFRRQKQFVLAEPLANTGIFLPLLSVLGFLFTDNKVHFSVLLLLAGGVYSFLAIRRKSFGFGILALILVNGGFWYWLHKDLQWTLLQHPQTWCIPPALCLLVAAQLNRARLSREQLATFRYGSLSLIYVSSTAEIFLRGVAQNPQLPMILGALSIAGIALGMFLRVRSFLWLGTSFLLISLLTLIWHAAVNLNQTWIWAASGIVAGIAIIAIFAVFEKKRQEITSVLARLQAWDE